MTFGVFFLDGVANGLAEADQFPKAEPADALKGDAECAVAFEDEATGWEVKADVCLMDEKGEAEAAKDPKLACAFLTGPFEDAVLDEEDEVGNALASLTFSATSSGNAFVSPPSKTVDGVAILENGEDVDAKLPNVACVFLTGRALVTAGVFELSSIVSDGLSMSTEGTADTGGYSRISSVNDLIRLPGRIIDSQLTSSASSSLILFESSFKNCELGVRFSCFLFLPVSDSASSTSSSTAMLCTSPFSDTESTSIVSVASSWLRSSTFCRTSFTVSSLVAAANPSLGSSLLFLGEEPRELWTDASVSVLFFFSGIGTALPDVD